MEIHFEIENRCLLKCRHCSSRASSCGGRMDYHIEDMVLFLNAFNGEKDVFLTGGEPLLYPQVELLLKRLKEGCADIRAGVFTSGIKGDSGHLMPVSEEYARQLVQNGLQMCYVSVYSSRADAHDYMTGQMGSFEMTKRAVAHLKKAGVEIRLNVVVTAQNEDEIEKIIEMAEGWGAKEVRLLKLIRHGRAEKCWDRIGLSEERYRAVVTDMSKKRKRVRLTASGAVDILPCRSSSVIGQCPAGKRSWYVTYRGDIYPCASVKGQASYKAGNIREGIWKKNEGTEGALQKGIRCEIVLCTQPPQTERDEDR